MLHNKTAACLALVAAAIGMSGCQTVASHRAAVQAHENRLTVGTVQREVRVGMSSAEVVQVMMGSPNIVSTDEQRRQVWIYDKIATDRVYSTSSGGINSLILGAATSALGGLGGGFHASSGASSTSQRTLTLIIKFDEAGKVRDFAYHSSRF